MPQKEKFKDRDAWYFETPAAWRKWLLKNHATSEPIWLVLHNQSSELISVTYQEALDEALCFGWIDSVVYKRDAHSRYQYFSPRKAKSSWSRVNKNKVEKLIEAGKMHASGMAMIDYAKKTGTWNVLDEVENLTEPEDLVAAFKKAPKAYEYWKAFSRSSKRGILEWINTAKRPETRAKRIEETVAKAGLNKRANFDK